MSRTVVPVLSVSFLLLSCATPQARHTPAPVVPADEPRISGPYSHDNLTVFLVHGPDRLAGREYVPLQQAIADKKVIVHETGNVNELAIENVSGDDVFIQAGDIVRGGQQDRTLADDLVLAAHSGRTPIGSFCVEQGRWSQRGAEVAHIFASSDNCLSSNSLKLAARYDWDQSGVWQNVAEQRANLDEGLSEAYELGRGGLGGGSTSLELAMEDENVKKAQAAYLEKLSGTIDGKPDVVGFAFAINGELNCADIYAGPGLFRKLWPKLLDAAVVEALGQRKPSESFTAPTCDDVRKLFTTAQAGKATDKEVSLRTRLITRDDPDCVLFETHDKQGGSEFVHRNYLRKLSRQASPQPRQQRETQNSIAPQTLIVPQQQR